MTQIDAIRNMANKVKNTPNTIKAIAITLPLLAYSCGEKTPEYEDVYAFENPKKAITINDFLDNNSENVFRKTYAIEDTAGIKTVTFNSFGNMISVENYDNACDFDQNRPKSRENFTYWNAGPGKGKLAEVIELENVKGKLEESKRTLFEYDLSEKINEVTVKEKGKEKNIKIEYDSEGRVSEQTIKENKEITRILSMYDKNNLKVVVLNPKSDVEVQRFTYENKWIKK